MKTIDLPSGAQLPCEPLVTNLGSEPSRFISQISGKPPRSVVYRIRLPSGEKRGSASGSVPLVSCFASLPLACMLQIFMVPLRSLTKTIVPLRLAMSILPEPGSGRARRADAPLAGLRTGSFGDRQWIAEPAATAVGLVAAIGLPRPPEAVAVGAEAGVGVNGELLVTVGRPELLGGAVPRAAAQHAHLARGRTARVFRRDSPRNRFRRTSRGTIARRCRASS